MTSCPFCFEVGRSQCPVHADDPEVISASIREAYRTDELTFSGYNDEPGDDL